MKEENLNARAARWEFYRSALYRRWRVYSTFLTGFLIGLLFVVVISCLQKIAPEGASSSQFLFGFIHPRTLVLIFSGIMGGVVYSILVNGRVEMPRFIANRGDQFESGLFGDILLGIAGAVVLDFLTQSTESFAATTSIQVAAVGLIGGYGGRALLQFALSRMFSDIKVLEEDRQQQLKAAYQGQTEAMAGLQVIDQLQTQIQSGLTISELAELTAAIRSAPAGVRRQVFDLARDFRRTAKLSEVTQPRIERTIPIFEALIDAAPDQHAYYAEAAFAYKDAGSPDLFKAIQYLDKAIELRGDRHQPDTWKYELSRAITRIQQAYQTQHSYTFDTATNEGIIKDLLAVAKVYNLENILKAGKEKNLPIPIAEWVCRNSAMLTARPDTRDLAATLLQSGDWLSAPSLGPDHPPVDGKSPVPNGAGQSEQLSLKAAVALKAPQGALAKPALDGDMTRWCRALSQAKPQGASLKTAGQDQLSDGGVQASAQMAAADWPRIKPYQDRFWTAARQFHLPPEFLAAIASRESRCGGALCKNQWGDGDQAFGIMQVDRNYHTVAGVGTDPASQAHINQAASILADYLSQVQKKFPDWDDSTLLEACAVAYNAGLNTVRTRERLNQGTTGDDYGADVMARAQFYSRYFADLALAKEPKPHAQMQRMEAVHDTWLKRSPQQASQLPEDQKRFCPAGTCYDVEAYEPVEGGYFRVKLADQEGDWYIFDSIRENHWDTTWENDHDESAESASRRAEDRLEQTRRESVGKQPVGAGLTKDMPFETLITPHITYGELTKYDEARRFDHDYQCKTAHQLCEFLEKCREHFGGQSVIITSGYRPEPINTQQNGAKGSEHLFDCPGKGAVDFHIQGVNVYEVQEWCLKNYPYSVGRGAHRNFVHVGIRPGKGKYRWDY